MTEPILLVKGISGLGDRILCFLTAVLYARLSGRRLIVDWRDDAYSAHGVNAFHHYFRSPLCSPGDEVPDTDCIAPAIWRGRLRDSASSLRQRFGSLNDAEGWRMFSIDLARLDHPELVAVLCTYGEELDPLLPHLGHAGEDVATDPAWCTAILRGLLADSLEPQPSIRERLDRFRAGRLGEGPVIGVHIRYTDHRTALRATLRALEHRLAERPSSQIFLCTDNRRVLDLFEDRYTNVCSTPHWYAPMPGRPLHYGGGRPDALQNGVDALVDLYLLAACDDVIVDTSSSFGYVATLLANARTARVMDVKRRGKLPPRVRHVTNRLMRRFRVHAWGPSVIAALAGPPPVATRSAPAGTSEESHDRRGR